MQLTRWTDFALRTLMLLGVQPDDRYVPSSEVSRLFELPPDHLRKVTHELMKQGWIEGKRGAGGGVRLAVDPATLRVGRIVSTLERLDLLECFDPDRDACLISAPCRLKHVLQEATQAFVAVLDQHTLADLVAAPDLRRVLLPLAKDR